VHSDRDAHHRRRDHEQQTEPETAPDVHGSEDTLTVHLVANGQGGHEIRAL
jgi:hypothetical protein